MPTEDVAYQQRLKIQRTTLGFGVIQVVLGLALTGLSFTAFVLSESEKIRNACPYWAGFTVFCSGGVGIVAWRHTTVLSMGLFTFFSAVCVVLHMIGTILTGEIGGLLKSIIMCQDNVMHSCMCCDSIMTCKQNVPTFEFKGVADCAIITGLMKELMYGLCVLNIFGSLVCFIATILGCTSVARQAGRDQPFFRRRLSTRSDSHEQSQYSWLHYPAETNVLPPYAPPIYRSVDNVQDCGATPYIVPPPVFDPTDLPPPYSSRNASLSSSGISLDVQNPNNPGRRPNDGDDGAGGSSAVVISESDAVIHHYENHYQQRVYSENRARPGNISQITSVVLTRGGITERSGSGLRIEPSLQSVNSSQVSVQSEKAEECRESNESINNMENNNKSKQTSFNTVERADEIIKFEENTHKRKSNKEVKRNTTKNTSRKNCKITEDDISSTSDSGIGDELSATINSIETYSLNAQEMEAALDKDTDVSTVIDCDKEKQDCNLAFAVSPDSQPSDDDITRSNDTLVNALESCSESGLLGACQLGNLGKIESHVTEMPIVLSLPNRRLEDELVCSSNVHEIRGQNIDFDCDNIMKKNEIRTIDDASSNFAENRSHEQHVTEEVIRLMDDFEANININRPCGYTLEPGNYIEEPADPNANDGFRRREDVGAESHKRIRQTKQVVPPRRPREEIHLCAGKEFLKKSETSLARSDTCIAVLPKVPRECRTGSDPGVRGVGSFVYPGLNQFPFQLVPPNVELPLEIREESIFPSPVETRRRKRYGERESSRWKRRALANKDLKAKSQHRTARKEELTRVRERHTKSQNSRLRVDVTRSSLQKYKEKSSAQRTIEERVANPTICPSRRKGKTVHNQNPSNLQSTCDVNSAGQCGTCSGKETMV